MKVLTIPTEVRAVTVLMMVGTTLNFPAWAEITKGSINLRWNGTFLKKCLVYLPMNYDVKADAISLNEGPRFHTVLIIIFGKPAQENIKKTSFWQSSNYANGPGWLVLNFSRPVIVTRVSQILSEVKTAECVSRFTVWGIQI